MNTLKEVAREMGYNELEDSFVARGIATLEEINRWQKNRELGERFGIEITN